MLKLLHPCFCAKVFSEPGDLHVYITQTFCEPVENFWGNWDSSVALNFHDGLGGELGVQDGKYGCLGQEALESCAFWWFFFFESFPILALKLVCFICPAQGIRHLHLMK